MQFAFGAATGTAGSFAHVLDGQPASLAIAATKRRCEMRGSELMWAFRCCGLSLRCWGIDVGRTRVLNGCRQAGLAGGGFGVVRPDIQVAGRALGDLFENGRGGLAAIITLLGLVYHHRDA